VAPDEPGDAGHENAHRRETYLLGSPAPIARKVLVSLGQGSQEQLLEVARPSFEGYAERFGYDLDLRTRAPATERPPAWAKVLILLELLDSYEQVVWVDADAVIVDPARDVAGELPAGSFLGLVEHRYERDRVPNTGVLVVRSSSQARRFWRDVWSRHAYIDHPWWENAAVCSVLGYRLPTWAPPPGGFDRWPWRHSVRHLGWHLQMRVRDRFGVQILPVRPKRGAPPAGVHLLDKAWNSIPADPAPHPRIKHYPGEPLDARLVKMRADVAAR